MSGLTLYDTTAEFRALLELMEQQDEDPSPAQELVIQTTIAQQVRKVDHFARFLNHLDDQVLFAADEIERLQARKKRMAKRLESLKGFALMAMDSLGFDSLDGETATLKIRLNPPAVNVLDENAVPAEFKTIKQTVHIELNNIKAALKAGKEVPGVELTQKRKVVVA